MYSVGQAPGGLIAGAALDSAGPGGFVAIQAAVAAAFLSALLLSARRSA